MLKVSSKKLLSITTLMFVTAHVGAWEVELEESAGSAAADGVEAPSYESETNQVTRQLPDGEVSVTCLDVACVETAFTDKPSGVIRVDLTNAVFVDSVDYSASSTSTGGTSHVAMSEESSLQLYSDIGASTLLHATYSPSSSSTDSWDSNIFNASAVKSLEIRFGTLLQADAAQVPAPTTLALLLAGALMIRRKVQD